MRLGDIVGCGIDLKEGKIDFWLNGEHLGTAWENILQEASNPLRPPFYPAFRYLTLYTDS